MLTYFFLSFIQTHFLFSHSHSLSYPFFLYKGDELGGRDVELSNLTNCKSKLSFPSHGLHLWRLIFSLKSVFYHYNLIFARICSRVSTVILMGHVGAIHIRGLVNSRLLTGPVARSMFIADCSNCVVAVACQQVMF